MMRKRRLAFSVFIMSVLAVTAYGVALAQRGRGIFAPLLANFQQAAETATPTLTATRTRTPFPAITPTETLVPPIDLPTLAAFVPFRLTWVDLPSYPFERALMTQLYYDPEIWSLTPDQYGNMVLAHRTIPYCQMARAIPRGLLPGWTTENETKKISTIFYDVVSVFENGQLRYINYFTAGKIAVKTGFEVAFMDEHETCIADAEKVLASLSFIPATPTSTPTETPTETSTPDLSPTP